MLYGFLKLVPSIAVHSGVRFALSFCGQASDISGPQMPKVFAPQICQAEVATLRWSAKVSGAGGYPRHGVQSPLPPSCVSYSSQGH